MCMLHMPGMLLLTLLPPVVATYLARQQLLVAVDAVPAGHDDCHPLHVKLRPPSTPNHLQHLQQPEVAAELRYEAGGVDWQRAFGWKRWRCWYPAPGTQPSRHTQPLGD
jgi:hypothetical protein